MRVIRNKKERIRRSVIIITYLAGRRENVKVSDCEPNLQIDHGYSVRSFDHENNLLECFSISDICPQPGAAFHPRMWILSKHLLSRYSVLLTCWVTAFCLSRSFILCLPERKQSTVWAWCNMQRGRVVVRRLWCGLYWLRQVGVTMTKMQSLLTLLKCEIANRHSHRASRLLRGMLDRYYVGVDSSRQSSVGIRITLFSPHIEIQRRIWNRMKTTHLNRRVEYKLSIWSAMQWTQAIFVY